MSGSKMKAFSADDPIRLLAHNLDFWVSAVTSTIHDRLRDFPEIDKGKIPGPVTLEDGSVFAGAVAGNPCLACPADIVAGGDWHSILQYAEPGGLDPRPRIPAAVRVPSSFRQWGMA